MIKQYIMNVLIGLDQFVNAIFWGSPQETISSRADKAMKKGSKFACVLCRFLSLFQKDHCQKSINPSVGSNAVIPD